MANFSRADFYTGCLLLQCSTLIARESKEGGSATELIQVTFFFF
jgi:hypothetical protein